MKSPQYSNLAPSFCKLFVSVSVLFLLVYIVGIIYQHVYMVQNGFGASSWGWAAVAAKVAVPVVLFVAGACLQRASWLHRIMAGVLCALMGLFAQMTLMFGVGMLFSVIPDVQVTYFAVEIGGALATVILGLAVLVSVRVVPRLWRQREVAYSSLLLSLGFAYVLGNVIDMMRTDGSMVLPMLVGNMIIGVLAILAFVLLRGLPWGTRVFRVVLVIVATVTSTLITSFAMSVVATSGAFYMEEAYSVYTVVAVVLPLLVYVSAAWFARPVERKLSMVKTGK